MLNQRPHLIPTWWEWNYWEPTVLQVLPDFCKPNDVVFDIGMNVGGLSLAMSRLVGPRGHVCSFEASPRIVDIAQNNMNINGCNNVTIYHRAVFSESDKILKIYGSETYLNDSVYTRFSGNEFHSDVRTISIDDYVSHTGLVPKFIKMDIEGAEYDALLGARKVLELYGPALILEQSPEDMRCHELLLSYGYSAVDLSTYTRINSKADFIPGTGVVNVLFLRNMNDSPYLRSTRIKEIEFSRKDIIQRSENEYGLVEPIALSPGRYIVKAHMTAQGLDNEVYAGLNDDAGNYIVRVHTHTNFLANSYTDWTLALRHESKVLPYLRYLSGHDNTLEWNGLTIYNIPEFGRQSSFALG